MSNENEKSDVEKRDALEKIIKASRTAFFVTHSGDEPLHGRPMANAHVEPGLSFVWFATQRDSGKIAELKNDQHVLLAYVNGSGSEWASVNGIASFVDDRAKIKEALEPHLEELV